MNRKKTLELSWTGVEPTTPPPPPPPPRVVRHRLAADGPYDVSDKFRVEVYFDTRDNRPVGRKQVISTLLKTKSQVYTCISPVKPREINIAKRIITL